MTNSTTSKQMNAEYELAEERRMLTAFYCGYITAVLSVTLILAHLHYIYRTVTQRKLGFHMEFSIVLLLMISIFDLLQLIAHFASAIQMIRYSQDAAFGVIELEDNWTGLLGALLTSSWNGASIALCYLTMHRCFWLCAPGYAEYVVSPMVSKVFLCLLTLFTFVNNVSALFVNDFKAIFYPSMMQWIIGPWIPMDNLTYVKWMILLLQTVTNSGVVYFNLPFLLGISYKMARRKRQYVNSSDRFVLFQMLSFYVYATFTWILWEFFIDASKLYIWKYFVCVFAWMIWNGMTPISAGLQNGIRFLHHRQRRKSAQKIDGRDCISVF